MSLKALGAGIRRMVRGHFGLRPFPGARWAFPATFWSRRPGKSKRRNKRPMPMTSGPWMS